MWTRLHVKYPLFLSDFNKNGILSTEFRKKAEISIFIKIRPMEYELFHADGETDGRTDGKTDMTKLIVFFLQFCERAYKHFCRLNINYFFKKSMGVNGWSVLPRNASVSPRALVKHALIKSSHISDISRKVTLHASLSDHKMSHTFWHLETSVCCFYIRVMYLASDWVR